MFTLRGNNVQRRLKVLTNILNKSNFSQNQTGYACPVVTIGDVSKTCNPAKRPEYVPKNYVTRNEPQSVLHHLRWMLRKDRLGQDMFLIGPPGAGRRRIAMKYLELTNQEHEYVALNRDTTESDLKQRREIVGGTAVYFDQSAVRAATEGRVLVLEGIEKAERNVLPVLNNLLENREMHLEDGRMLIPEERYSELLKEHGQSELDKWKLIKVDKNFKVIALGLPVPRFRGNPLDPPLRSRFQARDINVGTFHEWRQQLRQLTPNVPADKIETLLSVAFGLVSKESAALGLPEFPVDNLPIAALMLEQNPQLSVYSAIYRLYPYRTFLKDGINTIETLLRTFNCKPDVTGNCNTASGATKTENYIPTPYQQQLINDMLETANVSDFCLIGPSGCGKTTCIQQLSLRLKQPIENIVLYHDMTSRDLLQQRSTSPNGDTVWRFSPLVTAAIEGKMAVLDGLHRLHPSTLAVLQRLVQDRELQLYDGKRLVSAERYEMIKRALAVDDAGMEERGVFRVDPSFRVLGVGEPPKKDGWIGAEMLGLFVFHEMRMLGKEEEVGILKEKFGSVSPVMKKILDLAHTLRESPDVTLQNISGHLSTRQLLRIANRLHNFPEDDIYSIISETFMLKFLPQLTRQALENTLRNHSITKTRIKPTPKTIKITNGTLTIGSTSTPIHPTSDRTKIPKTLFYDLPQQIELMEKLLRDFLLGEHLLLVGNQGVGKNKLIDRFLELTNRPREYVQLHRDTTIQSLTVRPTVRDGRLVYEDSPLVKAVQRGHVLVVDEADKAPTHVTCVLKNLVESGQMVLSDGRRITSSPEKASDVRLHPDFRVVVLANRPGFPFLGNDFFAALGGLFSAHTVDNPSYEDEMELLRRYGPDVPEEVLGKLVGVFGELRGMADEGVLGYPYSTREVVNIVKHLQKFPNSDLEEVIFNVFDFDKYSPELVTTIGEVLHKYGFSNRNVLTADYILQKRNKEYLQLTVDRYSGLDTNAPKHGKEDPKNEPHVGGNTWAGGTGGRDTAGLGGKGGPYRLDKGHKVHQLSDEEKAAVPPHVTAAAREMGRRAFEQRLKEIGMSGYDASLYSQFSGAVSREVQTLRSILASLQAKHKERQWTRHQTSGELDDVKLIDGLLGEKNVYMQRKEEEAELGAPQSKPKLLRVVVDVSGSMYRFNSYDGRLDRELEAVVLVMEAFEGFDDKIRYEIYGHSGDTHRIEFVNRLKPPKNNKERLDLIRVMSAHSQFCWSGDNTLEATRLAIEDLSKEDTDESIVVVLSDANLQRYGISPSELGKVLTSSSNVAAYVVFIGGLGDQAERLTDRLPAGRAFICTDVSLLPQIMKQIFSSSLIRL